VCRHPPQRTLLESRRDRDTGATGLDDPDLGQRPLLSRRLPRSVTSLSVSVSLFTDRVNTPTRAGLHFWSLDVTEIREPPVLMIQIWDNDLFCLDDFLGLCVSLSVEYTS